MEIPLLRKIASSSRTRVIWALIFLLVVAGGIFLSWSLHQRQPTVTASTENISTANPQVPTGHPRVFDPASLDGPRAEAIYQAIIGQLESAYALSGDPVTMAYTKWRRYNRYPYRSAHHGNRYVNNYANEIARSYGDFERAGRMPAGAQIVKDVFVVTQSGNVFVGPFFLMEKMAPGFDPNTDDWRYMMIDAEGSLVGMTRGPNAERMQTCNACHARAPKGQDRLFFMPKPVRLSR